MAQFYPKLGEISWKKALQWKYICATI